MIRIMIIVIYLLVTSFPLLVFAAAEAENVFSEMKRNKNKKHTKNHS